MTKCRWSLGSERRSLTLRKQAAIYLSSIHLKYCALAAKDRMKPREEAHKCWNSVTKAHFGTMIKALDREALFATVPEDVRRRMRAVKGKETKECLGPHCIDWVTASGRTYESCRALRTLHSLVERRSSSSTGAFGTNTKDAVERPPRRHATSIGYRSFTA